VVLFLVYKNPYTDRFYIKTKAEIQCEIAKSSVVLLSFLFQEFFGSSFVLHIFCSFFFYSMKGRKVGNKKIILQFDDFCMHL